MAMGFQKDRQGDLVMIWSEMPRSPGHVLHDRLQQILLDGDVDGFGEEPCRPCCAAGMGAPSVPPAHCFRMHPVGHLEGIAWERGLAWRCWGSPSLRALVRLEGRDRVPDHSWLSRTGTRLAHAVHVAVLDRVLALIGAAGLVQPAPAWSGAPALEWTAGSGRLDRGGLRGAARHRAAPTAARAVAPC